MDPFFYKIIFTGVLAGASISLLGVYIVGMRIPFIGTCISHAAMAGIVFASIVGIPTPLGATATSMLTAASLSAIHPSRSRIDINVGLAILFSMMLGLTFLGLGIAEGSRAELNAILWGSLLFVTKQTAITISILTVVLLLFVAVFNKQLKVILFSRSMAAATGVHQGIVYFLFLILTGLIVAINVKLIGGLLLFSLLTNPAAAAYQICTGHKTVVITSIFFGTLSTISGFMVSFYLDLPTGACIVIASTFIFGLAFIYRRFRDTKRNSLTH